MCLALPGKVTSIEGEGMERSATVEVGGQAHRSDMVLLEDGQDPGTRQGRQEEAKSMLAELLGSFTEGFGTPDLQEAKALLAGL